MEDAAKGHRFPLSGKGVRLTAVGGGDSPSLTKTICENFDRQFCTTSPNILSVGILVGWPIKTSNVLGSIPTVAIPSPDHPPLVICLTRIIFCTKNKMYIHFNNFCIGILLGCPFKTWSTIGKVKVLFELQFNHYIYDMGGVRKWLLFGILLEFLCTLRPQCWEYRFVEIYICIEYMLPTIWVYLC